MARRARRAPASRVAEVTIAELGGRGDGIARLDGAPVYVPFALPGERLRVRLEPRGDGAFAGVPPKRLSAGAARAEPACPHFGACGGCAIQHWRKDVYRTWKRQLVVDALSHAGIAGEVGELIDAHGTGRRRATLHARQSAKGILRVGFVGELGSVASVGRTGLPDAVRNLDDRSIARLLSSAMTLFTTIQGLGGEGEEGPGLGALLDITA